MDFYLSFVKQKSFSDKFIWHRPIYSFHWAAEWEMLARQLNIFDAALSPSIMAREQTQNISCFRLYVLWLNKHFYVFFLCRFPFFWGNENKLLNLCGVQRWVVSVFGWQKFLLKWKNCRIVWCCKSRKIKISISRLVPFIRFSEKHFSVGAMNLACSGMGNGKNFYGWNHHSEENLRGKT